jgi:N utilization substance protein B
MPVRHIGRIAALQLLYQMDTADRFEDSEELLRLYFLHLAPEHPPEVRAFAESLCRGAVGRREEIDETLNRASSNWRLGRMSRVDRNILRLAVYELTAPEPTPARVVIDEAIELAKEFGTNHSATFINGVLNRAAHDLGLIAS